MIPKKLLPHSALVYRKIGMDTDRNAVYDEGAELVHIRITTTRAVVKGAYGKEARDSLVLFFDSTNSLPQGFVPEAGMKIVFDGREYEVASVTPCYAEHNRAEHWEAVLS